MNPYQYPESASAVAIYLSGLGTPESHRTMEQGLRSLAHIMSAGRTEDPYEIDWLMSDDEDLEVLFQRLRDAGDHTNTAKKKLGALRGVFRAAKRAGFIDAVRWDEVCGEEGILKLEAIDAERVGRYVLAEEIEAELRACLDDPEPIGGARDAALIALLFGAGLKRTVVASLRLAAVDLDSGRISFADDDYAQIATDMLPYVRRWVMVRGSEPGPLLYEVTKTGEVIRKKISSHAVMTALHRVRRRAGVEPHNVEDARRTLTTNLLLAGASIEQVRRRLRFRSPTQVANYDFRGEL